MRRVRIVVICIFIGACLFFYKNNDIVALFKKKLPISTVEKHEKDVVKKILYDCDPGTDDVLALLLAIRSNKIDLKGISCVHGNASVDKTTKNALRVLEYMQKDIPVAKGANKPLIGESRFQKFSRVHSKGGLGDSSLLEKEPKTLSVKEDAVDFIINNVKKGVKTIVATGPLTNIAHAFKKAPEIMNQIDELIIMGGVILKPGNVERLSEANFWLDPDAADFVLQQNIRKVLIPLNVTYTVIFTPKKRKQLGQTKTKQLIKQIFKPYQAFYSKHFGFNGCPVHDPLAIAYIIDPTLFTLVPMDIRVETKGELTRGMCVPELRKKVEKKYNCMVAIKVDADKFLQYLFNVL